jgi:protein phosphatase
MGTTVTGAMFDGVELGLAHIGDSRAYLYRDGHLERLTHDDTWVQSLVDEGKISEFEAAMHPHRSLLLKVLNGQPTNDPDLTMVPVKLGDRLMFCSDGVCGLIDDDMIESASSFPISTMHSSAWSSNLSTKVGSTTSP